MKWRAGSLTRSCTSTWSASSLRAPRGGTVTSNGLSWPRLGWSRSFPYTVHQQLGGYSAAELPVKVVLLRWFLFEVARVSRHPRARTTGASKVSRHSLSARGNRDPRKAFRKVDHNFSPLRLSSSRVAHRSSTWSRLTGLTRRATIAGHRRQLDRRGRRAGDKPRPFNRAHHSVRDPCDADHGADRPLHARRICRQLARVDTT
jgi:hypothetical protein